MKAGRPLKYKTLEELEEAIVTYFTENPQYPTITGLALHLGFDSRRSFYNYQDRRQFSRVMKRAALKIESIHEANLYSGAPTGSIFWLKNRDWKDKQEQEHSILPPIRMEIVDAGKPEDHKQPNDE